MLVFVFQSSGHRAIVRWRSWYHTSQTTLDLHTEVDQVWWSWRSPLGLGLLRALEAGCVVLLGTDLANNWRTLIVLNVVLGWHRSPHSDGLAAPWYLRFWWHRSRMNGSAQGMVSLFSAYSPASRFLHFSRFYAFWRYFFRPVVNWSFWWHLKPRDQGCLILRTLAACMDAGARLLMVTLDRENSWLLLGCHFYSSPRV